MDLFKLSASVFVAAVTPWSVSPVRVIVSTPSRCRLFPPVYLSLCFLSLCASSSCMFPSQPAFFPVLLLFTILLFLVLPVLTLACFWTLYPPAWPFCLPWPRAWLPLCTSWTLIWFDLLPVHDHSLAYYFWINKHCKTPTICLCLHLGLALCLYSTNWPWQTQ